MCDDFERQIQSKEQFESLIAGTEPVLLYFSSEQCNVCHAVYPRLKALIAEKPIRVGKIMIDDLAEIASQYLVFTVPTVLILQEGRELLRESRFIDFNQVARILELLNQE